MSNTPSVDYRMHEIEEELEVLRDALTEYALRPEFDDIWDAYTERADEFMQLFNWKMNITDD